MQHNWSRLCSLLNTGRDIKVCGNCWEVVDYGGEEEIILNHGDHDVECNRFYEAFHIFDRNQEVQGLPDYDKAASNPVPRPSMFNA